MSRLTLLLNYTYPPKIEPKGLEAKFPFVTTSASFASLSYFIHYQDNTITPIDRDTILDTVFKLMTCTPFLI